MPQSDDEILKAARERLAMCIEADHENRAEALDDMRFLAGEQWPDQVKAQRTLERRPCLTINTLPAMLHQVTNDQRQNTPSIKVHPVDDKADPETAKVLQGMIRNIEYQSNADVAYDTSVNCAAASGAGYFRLITEYESDDSFDQVARFKRIRNPLSVYFDPYSQEPDGSDANFCFLTDLISKDEFKRLYPDAKVTDSASLQGLGDTIRHWVRDSGVVVAEYYRVENTPAKLLLLADGRTVWEDELSKMLPKDAPAVQTRPTDVQVIKERSSFKRKVMWSKITACDVLETSEIPCKWIPVFPVYGSELDIEGKVQRAGLIRNSKDSARTYNFWMTCATEEVSLRPKAPYIGAEGQFEGHPEWNNAHLKSYAKLEYKPVTIGGQMAPPPQRQPMADVPVGALQMTMHARDNIKATMGLFDASLGARGNETSGRAIMARERQGDTATFHFADNLVRSIRHAGRCLVNMIPRVYDTQRVVRIMGEDEAVASAQINTEERDEQGAVQRVLNDLTVGSYDVTVQAGPSYSTLRQEAAQAMVEMGQSWPKLMDVAGDKVVKAMDWPGADEISERIKKTIPKEITQDEDEDGEGQGPQQLPPEVQQQMQQMDQAIQQMSEQLQMAESGLEKARIDAAAKIEVARINAEGRQDVEEIKGWIQMLLQRMQPPPMLSAAALQTGAQPNPQGPQDAGFVVSGADSMDATPQAPGMDDQPQGAMNPPPLSAGTEFDQ